MGQQNHTFANNGFTVILDEVLLCRGSDAHTAQDDILSHQHVRDDMQRQESVVSARTSEDGVYRFAVPHSGSCTRKCMHSDRNFTAPQAINFGFELSSKQ